jgi:DNA polymerase-3 subunit delta
MADLTFDALHRALKQGDVANVYYLVGPEDVLKDEAVRLVLDRVLDPSLRDFNFDQRTAAGLDGEALESLLDTLPMLAERRVVVLRDVDGWQKKARTRTALLKWLAKPAPDTVLLLVQSAAEPEPDKEFAARAVTVRCDALPPERAAKWVQREAAQSGLVLAPDAAAHLVKAVGAELSVLRAETAKLASLPEGTEVTLALIGDLVGVRHGETITDWRDAVLDDDTPRAAALVDPVLSQSGVSGVKLVTLLGTTLVGVSLARAQLDRGMRGRSLEQWLQNAIFRARPFGLPDWRAEPARWARWAERWSAERLRDALAATLAADQALKGTTLRDESSTMLDLVLQLAASASRRAA